MKTSEQRTEEILRRAEAQRESAARRSKRAWLLSVTAGFLILVLALNLLLFLPYPSGLPDLSRYAGSEYYGLMQQLNALTYRAPQYKNNFEAWFGDLFSGSNNSDGMGGEAVAPDEGNGGSAYAEVTDNQEAGVIEGDLFKRTQSHIFYVRQDDSNRLSLLAYTIGGTQSALCSRLEIAPEGKAYFPANSELELYLSEDGKTATVFTVQWAYEQQQRYTAAISVDVSDPAHMKEVRRTYLSGDYVTSRKAGEDFLLISNFAVRSNPDFSDEAQFLPQAGAYGALESLPMADIVAPENADAARYTVLCRLGSDLAVKGHVALLSFSEEAYVSQGNIFVTRGYTADTSADGETVSYTYREARTEISCISYAGGGLREAGSADVPGEVRNQYFMDEQDGMLRVVTSTDAGLLEYAGDAAALPHEEYMKSASLFVIDLETFETAASLERFAPAGESAISVRFEEGAAWVCTAIEYESVFVEDPVFHIDLTDLANITYTDTGTIPGYSLSLVDFTGGTLLGIGRNDDFDLKIEVYERAPDAVLPVASYERNADFSEEYKAYYIDRENGLIGLHIDDYEGGASARRDCYVLLHYDGYGLNELLALPLEEYYSCDETRATIIDGCLYVVTPVGIYTETLPWQGA